MYVSDACHLLQMAGSATQAELKFQQDRMEKLEAWLRAICAAVPLTELCKEDSACIFMELNVQGLA